MPQAVTGIPPFAFQNYPVDIHIRIYQEGARYKTDIFAVGRMLRVPIEMSTQDLLSLNKQLEAEMRSLTSGDVRREKLTTEEFENQLRPIAEVGNFAFKRIFSHHDAQTVIQELLTTGQRISIQVASEDFFLPWEFLYPVNLNEPLSYHHFWGMNYIISRVVVQEVRPGSFVSPVIPILSRPRLGLLTYSELPGVVKKEMPFFENLENDGKIHLFVLRALHLMNKREEFKEFKGFWTNNLNVVHFACHASYEDPPTSSYILLSDNFPITLMDMEVYGITVNNNPLIIMNACETGNLNPLYTSYFAAAFLKYGARGVVATECAVPDDFAAEFAEQLYTHLLTEEPLGESLLAARRHFLEEYSNPSGLLYSMYASPLIRFAKAGD